MKRVYSVISAFCCGCINQFHAFINIDKRRVILAFVIGAISICATNTAIAQTSAQPAKSASAYEPAKAGTYQLIFNNSKGNSDVKLDDHELRVIEKLRQDNEVVYAHATYSDAIRVKILPRSVINSPSFKPLPLKYFKDEQPYEDYAHIRYIELQ